MSTPAPNPPQPGLTDEQEPTPDPLAFDVDSDEYKSLLDPDTALEDNPIVTEAAEEEFKGALDLAQELYNPRRSVRAARKIGRFILASGAIGIATPHGFRKIGTDISSSIRLGMRRITEVRDTDELRERKARSRGIYDPLKDNEARPGWFARKGLGYLERRDAQKRAEVPELERFRDDVLAGNVEKVIRANPELRRHRREAKETNRIESIESTASRGLQLASLLAAESFVKADMSLFAGLMTETDVENQGREATYDELTINAIRNLKHKPHQLTLQNDRTLNGEHERQYAGVDFLENEVEILGSRTTASYVADLVSDADHGVDRSVSKEQEIGRHAYAASSEFMSMMWRLGFVDYENAQAVIDGNGGVSADVRTAPMQDVNVDTNQYLYRIPFDISNEFHDDLAHALGADIESDFIQLRILDVNANTTGKRNPSISIGIVRAEPAEPTAAHTTGEDDEVVQPQQPAEPAAGPSIPSGGFDDDLIPPFLR